MTDSERAGTFAPRQSQGAEALPPSFALGLAAAFATVVLWAGFLLVTRFAVTGHFTVIEVLTLRVLPGLVLLAPVMWRRGVLPRGLAPWRAAVLMFGASLGFPLIVMLGLRFAPASDAGALAPGTLPFWTALAAWVFMGEVPGPRRRAGLALILGGAMVVSLWHIVADAGGAAWRGHLLFLTGAGTWGIYTVVFRQSGLSPIHAAAIGLFWGSVALVPLALWDGLEFAGADLRSIAVMALIQGIAIGVLALLFFGYAVRALGAAETGAFGAMTPILALLGGAAFLDEAIGPLKVAGVLLVAIGVVLASGVLSRRKPLI